MAIAFTCPNGHALSAGDDKAGRNAKCPKCNAVVKIPGLSSPAHQGIVPSAAGHGPSGSAENGSPPLSPGLIVFLCPNGHRLNGPAKLQGKAGQCPHCGAKFRIPFQDPEEEAAYQSQQAAEHEYPGELAPEEDSMASEYHNDDPGVEEELSHEQIEEYHPEEDEDPIGELVEYAPTPTPQIDLGFSDTGDVAVSPQGTGGGHNSADSGWAVLFPFLWKQKSPGSDVDVYAQDGTKLTPQWFSPTWSLGEQAVFAIRDTEGSYTISSIPWEAIIRVEVRGVIDLPDGIFE